MGSNNRSRLKTKKKKNVVKQDKNFVVQTVLYIPIVYYQIGRYLFKLSKKHTVIAYQKTRAYSVSTSAVAKKNISTVNSNLNKKIHFYSRKLRKNSRKAYKKSRSNWRNLGESISETLSSGREGIVLKSSKFKLSVQRSFRNYEKRIVLYRKSLSKKKISAPKVSIREVKAPKINVNLHPNISFKNKFRLKYRQKAKLKKLIVLPILNFFKKVLYIILYPFRLVKRILHAIFTFEFKIRIFSFKTFLLLIIVGIVYLGSVVYVSVLEDLPDLNKLTYYNPRLTTTIYDRKGNTLYRVYSEEDRSLAALNEIPESLRNATIAIEDQDFYTHNGLSFRGIARAIEKNMKKEELEGGSTITQQLVKNTLLTPDRTLQRKVKEAIIALEVERTLSKDQILEKYLNTISYGGTTHGIKSAAKRYFNKDLKDLTLGESAYLAGLPAAPTTYSPYGSSPELGKARQKDVLIRMIEDGYINADQAEEAMHEQLVFAPRKDTIIAPHFVNYVLEDLEKKYGQQLVSQGGLEVYTSLDLEVQRALEDIVSKNVEVLKNRNVTNGAALITSPKTGEVLAMVGSANYWDIENDGNVNVTTSLRQPGSSIKAITYSLALENGYNLKDTIVDAPVTYGIAGSKPYSPVNYDGRFHGTVTLMSALANSYNVPAVKLLNSLGVDKFLDFGEKMGISTWSDRSRYGLSVTLGAGEVKMTDMATVYGVFANGGYRRDLDPVLKIYDSYGNVLQENDCVNFLNENPSILTRRAQFDSKAYAAMPSMYDEEGAGICDREKVIDGSTAYFISYALSSNPARTPAFGGNSDLNIKDRQVAVKTGTTSNLKDNWAIGYTNDYVVVSWVGNNNGDPMKDVTSGYHGSSQIWRQAFDYLIKNRTVAQTIEKPEGIVEVEICPLTKTLACDACPNVKMLYKAGEEPKVACDSNQVRDLLERQKKAEEEKKKAEEEKKEEDNNDEED